MSSNPQRWLLPPAIAITLAVVGSLALHVPVYVGLGVLKEVLRDSPRAPELPPPMEIEIVERRPSDTETAIAEPTEPVDEEKRRDETSAPEQAQHVEARRPPVAEPEAPRQEPAVAPPPPPSRPEPARRTSVAHRSRDPNVAPPDDAQYLAEENSRVEEETMARVRNAQTDDPEPQVAASEDSTPQSADEGDATAGEVADLQDADGNDERNPTPEEARVPPAEEREREPSRTPRPTVAEAAVGDGRSGAAEAPEPAREAAGGGRQAQGGGERAMREVVVSDGTGTFRMRVPAERPEGEGEGEGGGLAVDGAGRGTQGEGRASGRAGRGRTLARGGGSSGRGAPDLRVSWTDFTSIYGEEELEREREAYLSQRRSRTRGASHQERWERFRAAIENYDVSVRPGNQTALNTRADPFAAYIASMHRRIHRRFAEDFLRHLPSTVPASMQANPDMHAKLEIAVGANGTIERIGVIATSGDILFDFGAYNAVMQAQPFEPTPENIRSPDGLVYLHWSFYANHRQCGTFNAEAYILARAPRRGDSSSGTLPPRFDPAELDREVPDRSRRDGRELRDDGAD